MKNIRKFSALIALFIFFGSFTQSLHGEQYCSEIAGCGYEECRSAPCVTPAIALGAIALVAIIAVALQNSEGGSCHGHSHCH